MAADAGGGRWFKLFGVLEVEGGRMSGGKQHAVTVSACEVDLSSKQSRTCFFTSQASVSVPT